MQPDSNIPFPLISLADLQKKHAFFRPVHSFDGHWLKIPIIYSEALGHPIDTRLASPQ